jgi:hypothetical protein
MHRRSSARMLLLRIDEICVTIIGLCGEDCKYVLRVVNNRSVSYIYLCHL